MSLILEALGINEEDPEVISLQEDFNDFADLISYLVGLRKASGKTQQEIADIMGTKQSAVSAIESSSANPSVQRLQRYARAVGARLLLHADPLQVSQDGWQVIENDSIDGVAIPGRIVGRNPFAGPADWEVWDSYEVA